MLIPFSFQKLFYHINAKIKIFLIFISTNVDNHIIFFNDIAHGNPLSDSIYGTTTSTIFICTQKYSRVQRTIPSYIISYMSGAESIVIGEFRNDIQDSITLDLDNRFLYSGQLHQLYEFEQTYSLSFGYIKYLDVCCDANQNLPRKLNTIMHSPECEVGRRGAKKELTSKGNQRLGWKDNGQSKDVNQYRTASGIILLLYEAFRLPTACYITLL